MIYPASGGLYLVPPRCSDSGSWRIAQRFGPDVLVDYVVEQMTEAIANEQPFLIVHNELLPHFPMIDTPDDRRLGRQAKLGNSIEYMDKLVGPLLDSVTDLGIRDNTYIVFMGDNGTQAPYFQNPRVGKQGDELEHTRRTIQGNVNGGKAEHGDAGCHVPFLVWGPKSIPAGTVCDDLIDVVDLFPTFCELSSTTIPGELAIDGRTPGSGERPGRHCRKSGAHCPLQKNHCRRPSPPPSLPLEISRKLSHRRGKVQLIQYKLIFHVTEVWFEAMRTDLGDPIGPY